MQGLRRASPEGSGPPNADIFEPGPAHFLRIIDIAQVHQQWPLGDLPDTVKIERVRSGDSRRRTTVWLATDWHYLLVKLEQVSASGTETSLSLEAATVNREALHGL